MTCRRIGLRNDERGAAVIEIAIALPVLVTMIYGIFSIGQLFQANAGIQHALGEGARYGTLCVAMSPGGGCTLPSDTQLATRVNDRLFGTFNGTFDPVTVDSSTLSSGYKTITVTYHQTMSFAFFTGPTIDISKSKRVYIAQ
jgi:Flp pilus assembly protein TadG